MYFDIIIPVIVVLCVLAIVLLLGGFINLKGFIKFLKASSLTFAIMILIPAVTYWGIQTWMPDPRINSPYYEELKTPYKEYTRLNDELVKKYESEKQENRKKGKYIPSSHAVLAHRKEHATNTKIGPRYTKEQKEFHIPPQESPYLKDFSSGLRNLYNKREEAYNDYKQKLEKIEKTYDLVYFAVYSVIATISIIAGIVTTVTMVGTGFLVGGISCLSMGYINYWDRLGALLRLSSLLLILIISTIFGYWVSRRKKIL
ncbi:hypothetical protein HN446_02345 [bacterium]|jgi:hypothetical protein|nr:hypothetical protein [bacterium]